jgi:hypothetical protein
MRRSSPLVPLAALATLVSGLALSGCSGSDESASLDEGTSADEIRDGRCVAARRYDALLVEGTCTDVPGIGGTWVTQSLFPDAPPAVRDTSCAYKWVGSRKVDYAAITSLEHASVLSPVCGASRSKVSTVVATEEASYLDVFIMGGATGCDVCGKLEKDKAWIVLPADRGLIGKVQVPYVDDGHLDVRGRALLLGPIPAGVRAVSIDLPPAPRGKTYATGVITVY